MRRATMSTAWLLSESGEVQGLSLGADACSEHEWGVDGLRDALGTPYSFENGMADRKATQAPPTLGYVTYTTKDGEPAAWLVIGNQNSTALANMAPKDLPRYLGTELDFRSTTRGPEQDNTVCAWYENGAFIHVKSPEHVKRLEVLYKAFKEGDIAFGGDLVDDERHNRVGGLVFVRPSQVPPHIAERALEKDQKALRLRHAAENLGMEQELRAAGKRWFALSPRWKDKEESEVVFWLNPMDQKDHKSGLYTVEQLRQWARDEGPIMIDKPLATLARKHYHDLGDIQTCMGKQGYQVPSLSIEWKDKSRQEMVVRVSYRGEAKPSEKRLEGTVFDLADLQAQFPKPAPKKRAPSGSR